MIKYHLIIPVIHTRGVHNINIMQMSCHAIEIFSNILLSCLFQFEYSLISTGKTNILIRFNKNYKFQTFLYVVYGYLNRNLLKVKKVPTVVK